MRKNRILEALDSGAEYLLVTCPKCLTHFNCFISEPGLDEKQKEIKNNLKIVDLASFIGEGIFLI